MTDLTICAAQYAAVAGQLTANIDRHAQFMRHAAQQGVNFLLFPELSLTGYEPSLARALAQAPDANVLQSLRTLATELAMTTVVGLPLRSSDSESVMIGALVFAADGSQLIYEKQHLHPGEDVVFTAGHGGDLLCVEATRIALSVCADFAHPSHPRAAAHAGAGIYASSVLISDNGYAHDSNVLQACAAEHSMAVLMANHGGPSGGWACAGRSAMWAPGGKLVARASGTGDCLVIARRRKGVWHGEVMALSDRLCVG
jgi:predicted amidohydrolase